MSFSVNDITMGGYIGKIGVNSSNPDNLQVKINLKVQYKKEEEKDKNWFTVYASGKTAELINKYYQKGSPIQFKGFLSSTPKENGVFTYLTITKLIFLPRNSSTGNQEADQDKNQNQNQNNGFAPQGGQPNGSPAPEDDDIPF